MKAKPSKVQLIVLRLMRSSGRPLELLVRRHGSAYVAPADAPRVIVRRNTFESLKDAKLIKCDLSRSTSTHFYYDLTHDGNVATFAIAESPRTGVAR